MMRALLLVLGAALGSPNVASAADIRFRRDIAPIFKANCAMCHLTGQEAGNLALHPAAAYASLVNRPSFESKLLRIKPGVPEQSYLMLKLEGKHLDAGGSGQRMPLGLAPLDEATLRRIASWIAAGAENN